VIALGLLACSRGPTVLTARAVPGGFDVVADAPIERVEVLADGPVVRRTLPAPSEDVWLDAPWKPGATYRIVASGGGREVETSIVAPDPGPVFVAIEAPIGQQARPVADGDRLELWQVGASVPIGVEVTALEPVHVEVALGATTAFDLRVPGERRVVGAEVSGPVAAEVRAGDRVLHFALEPAPVPEAEAARRLEVVDVAFPADPLGKPDLARPQGRVTLPSLAWDAVLHRTGIGFRPSDSQAPWGLVAARIANRGDSPLDVVVSQRVLDGDAPAHAFRPRLRDADGSLDRVSALLRVPAAGEGTAVLPLYVDRDEVRPGVFTAEIAITPLGAATPLRVDRRPIAVERGSTVAGVGFLVSLVAAAVGLLGTLRRVGPWLRASPTSDLTTIALFASVQFVLGLASQLFATVATTLICPFAPLITCLADDALRAAITATLVTLLPRPGVVTTSLVVGYLLRVLALGSFTPVDAIWLGASITWLEGSLWLAGITRSPAWRDQGRAARWARLSLGIGLASVLSAASAFAVHVLLYRLFYATWFVAMVLALPSFAYIVLACAIAVPFAESLRRLDA
jgi:hypothetical protein